MTTVERAENLVDPRGGPQVEGGRETRTAFGVRLGGVNCQMRPAPAERLGDLAHRRRLRRVLVRAEPVVERGARLVEAGRQPRARERRRDLLHLTDEAPGLPRVAGEGRLRPGAETGLGALPFGAESPVHTLANGQRSHGEEQGARALRPRGVRHLEGRGRADVARHDDRLQGSPLQQARGLSGARAGQVEPGRPGLAGRRPDDAPVDQLGTRRAQDLAHPSRRPGRDGVRVHVEAPESLGGDEAGEVRRGARRAHGEDHVAGRQYGWQRTEVLEVGGLRTLARGAAAARRRPHHAHASRAQAFAHHRAHLTGMQQSHRRRHVVSPSGSGSRLALPLL